MKKRVIDLESLLEYEEYERPCACEECGGGLKYEGIGEYKCDTCGHIQYDAYGIVRRYIESHPNATILKIEKATGVSTKIISSLVREGKFEFKGDAKSGGENE